MRSRVPLLIVLIALLIFGLLVFFGIVNRLRGLTAELPRVLENELEARLNRAVRIRSIKLPSPTTAVIADLRMIEREAFGRDVFFSSRRAVVRFDTLGLLLRRVPATHSIRSVTLIEPSLRLIRNKDGMWNIEDLLARPPVPPSERFRGFIRVRSGRVTVMDHTARLGRPPAVNALRAVSGNLSFAPERSFLVDLIAHGTSGRVREIKATGRWAIDAPVTNLNLVVREADARYWLDYFSDVRVWNIGEGTFDARAVLSQPRRAGIVARGTASLRNSTVTSPYLAFPIKPFTANIRFTGTNINLTGQGYLRKSPARVDGRILGLAPARLNLRISSERMDFNTLQAAVKPLPKTPGIRWISPGTLSTVVTGLGADPTVTATARVPAVNAYGVRITDLGASGFYKDEVIRITRAAGRAAGGSASLAGTIALRPVRINVSGTAADINLAALPAPPDVQLGGTGDLRFALDYLGGLPRNIRGLRRARFSADIAGGRLSELTFARAQADVSLTGPRTAEARLLVTQGKVAGISIDTTTARLALRDRRVLVREILIRALQGTITGQGMATLDGQLNLQLAARNISLRALLALFEYDQFTGTARFDGNLTGTLADPRLAGQVESHKGRLRGTDYDLISARLTASRARLALEDATVRLARAKVVTTGYVVIARKVAPRVELQLCARELDLSQLVGLLGIPVRARGSAGADMRVRGDFPNLMASGEITVADAVVAGVPVDFGRLRLESAAGRTVIRELVVQRAEARLAGSGFVGPQGQLRIDLTGENLRLSLLNDLLHPYAALEGPVAFAARVTGTLRRPLIEGRILSDAPVVNRRSFDSLAASVSWDGVGVTLSDAVLAGGEARYEVPQLRFNPRVRYLDLRVATLSDSINPILDVLQNSPLLGVPQGEALRQFLAAVPSPFSGEVSASLRLGGRVGRLNGQASLTAGDVQMGEALLSRAEIGFVAQESILLPRRVALTSPGIDFAASAEFVRGMPTRMCGSIEHTDIGSLLDLVRSATFLRAYDFGQRFLTIAERLPNPFQGTLDAEISAADLQTMPTGKLSIAARDVAIAGTAVGDVTADARLVEGTTFLDRLALAGPQGRASAEGTISPDGLLSLTSQGSRISLSILRPWFPDAKLSGTVDFGFTATGPTANPMVRVFFEAADVQTPWLTIAEISAEQVTVADNRISSDQVTIRSNSSRLLLSGSLPFVWMLPFVPRDQPILVQADLVDQDFSILKSLSRIVDDARGALTARVEVTGTISQPIMNGEITLRNGSLDLSGFENDFTEIEINARFEDSSLLIETLSGASSLGGTFSGGGDIMLADAATGLVSLLIDLNSLRLDMANFADGDQLAATMTGQLLVGETVQSPVVQGQLVVRDARIRIPAKAVPTTIQIPQLPISPQLAVTLNLARDVIVERGSLRAEIVGPITVGGTMTHPVVAGTVQVVNGRLSYPGRRLDISPGGTASILLRPPLPAAISVSVTATTRVTTVSPLTGRTTRYRVTLDIAGPIGNLDIAVRSTPPGLPDIEALSAIFGGAPLEALRRGQPIERVFQDQMGQILLGLTVPGLFEPLVIEGIVFAIEPGFDVPFLATASTQLTDRITLSYGRSLMGNIPTDTFSLSCILSRQLAFTVQFEGQDRAPRETTYLLEHSWRF